MKALFVASSLLLCCSLAGAQSLADLSKKEKERRKVNADSGKESVVDVGEGMLDSKASPSPDEDPEAVSDSSASDERAEIQERIEELRKKHEKEVRRCYADIDQYGVTKGVEIPSCRNAYDMRAEIRALEKKLR